MPESGGGAGKNVVPHLPTCSSNMPCSEEVEKKKGELIIERRKVSA
jgi:hypothetical protein